MMKGLFGELLEGVMKAMDEVNNMTIEEIAMQHFIHETMDVTKVQGLVEVFKALYDGYYNEVGDESPKTEGGLKALAYTIFEEMGVGVNPMCDCFQTMYEELEYYCDSEEKDFFKFIVETLKIANGDYDDTSECDCECGCDDCDDCDCHKCVEDEKEEYVAMRDCTCNDCPACLARHKDDYIMELRNQGKGILPIGSCLTGDCGRCIACIDTIAITRMSIAKGCDDKCDCDSCPGCCKDEEHETPNLVYRQFEELVFEGEGVFNLKLDTGMKAVVKLMVGDEE